VFRLPTHNPCRRRPGVILLVVVVLLSLFATVGVAFVLYAESEAAAARLSRDAESLDRADVPPEVLLNYFLGQLLYDVPDNDPGVYSALRGHSLARLLYGCNDDDPSSNTQPFNGTGRLHAPSPFAKVDDYSLINYTYFPADGFLRDPERLGFRNGLARPRGPYTGGFNVPYTYPDLNNMFLAAVKANGTVLVPSFHRPWLFGRFDDIPGWPPKNPGNANWTNAAGKYLLLRPRPVDMGPGFPYPEDAGGDVTNLIGGPGGCDSVWLDLNFPVLIAPNGRKYKPLFAPLIADLDNRINVNVHGNVRGRDAQGNLAQGDLPQASNQGWGPWEVGLQWVLDPQSNNPGEWTKLFVGSTAPALPGRYGGPAPAGQPPGPALPPNNVAAGFPPPHFYAQVDYDGWNELAGVASKALNLPGGTSNCFPTYPGGYGNGSAAERTDHPLLFNFFQPVGDDRVFPASQMEALLRYGDTGSPALTSVLFRLCPGSFTNARTRGLVTTHSFDRVSPGAVSWIYDPARPDNLVNPNAGEAPSWNPVRFPPLNLRPLPPPPGSDFRTDWRAGVGLQRFDLNRPLPPFPNQRTGTVPPYGPPPIGPFDRFDDPAAADQFLEAMFERQRLADQVYRTLLTVTGMLPVARTAAPTDGELQPRRWLAQLAANIVDFVDDDDIPTPFNFYTEQDAYPNGRPPGVPPFDVGAAGGDRELPRYWVFGVELPHVLLNEVLAEYQEPAPAQRTPGAGYDVRLWVELHNPFQVPPAGLDPRDGLPVALHVPALPPGTSAAASANDAAFAPYQLVVADGLVPRPGRPRRNDNVLGAPYQVRCATTDADFTAPAPTIGGRPQAPPPPGVPAPYIDLNRGRTRNAFFLLGPPGSDAYNTIAAPTTPTGSVPASTPYVQSANLSYRVTYGPGTPASPTPVTVLLRRLVNPHIPFDPRPSLTLSDGEVSPNPWYNPYLTVDYLDGVRPHNTTDSPYSSSGKLQPYAADSSQVVPQEGGRGPTQHTFGQSNKPDHGADWLVHLDRQLINPMELLQVAGCQPYQLTHKFMPGFQHRAPWFDESHRLYRLFELLEIPDRAGGAAGSSARVAGKVNLNTVWDLETFRALCDRQLANSFQDKHVDEIFAQLLARRTPSGVPGPTYRDLAPGMTPPPQLDRPFLSLATGVTPPKDTQYPLGSGINDTLLRSAVRDGGLDTARLFQVPDTSHPYLQDQLLTKLYGNVTTRSNVFAVWLTVGFFEVTDDTTRPVKLGPEVGRAEMRHVRHRLFAIVDRSALAANPRPVQDFEYHRDSAVLFVSVIQ
jgi:hypothetical protein